MPFRHIYCTTSLHHHHPYNFAPVCAFFNIGSIFVAFITSPRIFSFPLINSFCAFALPLTSLPNSSSLSTKVTEAFLGGSPLPTVPDSLRSMYHFSSSPALFLSWKTKMAPPFLMASSRPASSLARDCAMASKATEEGKLSVRNEGQYCVCFEGAPAG